MVIRANVICPYCGYESSFMAESTWGRKLHNCDVEIGGCEGDFVVEYFTKLETTIKRVEGEEKYALKKPIESEAGEE